MAHLSRLKFPKEAIWFEICFLTIRLYTCYTGLLKRRFSFKTKAANKGKLW